MIPGMYINSVLFFVYGYYTYFKCLMKVLAFLNFILQNEYIIYMVEGGK